MFDLIIRNGTILDGSGKEKFIGDLAIDQGRIRQVGEVAEAGRQEIDAEGKLVTPGWVDIHTHYDGQATWDPLLAPSSWHGVTTVVMGNCGVGFAPMRPNAQKFLIELMEGVEDIPGSALAEGMSWQWETFPEYLDALEKMPRAIDVATQVPHGAIRAYVMGERCNQDDDPSQEEIAEMAKLVREGMEAGALGFSSSRTLLHKDVHGECVPGTFAGSDEMLQLGLAMKGLKHGIFEMVSDYLGDEDEWRWVKQFARETGKPVTLIGTTPAAYEGGKIYDIARKAAAEGMDIRPQVGARPPGILHGLQSNFHVFTRHPTYQKELAHLPFEEKLSKMQDPAMREKILSEKSAIRPGSILGNVNQMMERIFPLGELPNYEPRYQDSVAGLAEAKGVTPFEAMYDLLIALGGKELFYQPLFGYGDYSLEMMGQVMKHPRVLMGLSDGGAHCGIIADAGMPTFMMTHWGRDRTRGEKLPLEFIVNSLTCKTAEAYGMTDRGLLEEGKIADVNIIDFDKLRLFRPEAVYDLPKNSKRLVQRVEGYDYTIKAGEVIFKDGEHTGRLPGKLVRGGADN